MGLPPALKVETNLPLFVGDIMAPEWILSSVPIIRCHNSWGGSCPHHWHHEPWAGVLPSLSSKALGRACSHHTHHEPWAEVLFPSWVSRALGGGPVPITGVTAPGRGSLSPPSSLQSHALYTVAVPPASHFSLECSLPPTVSQGTFCAGSLVCWMSRVRSGWWELLGGPQGGRQL